MRSFLEIASGDDEVVHCADWAEVCSLFKADATISQEDLAREIHRSGLKSEANSRLLASEAFDEIDDRIRSIGAALSTLTCYPFTLSQGRDVIELTRRPEGTDNSGLLYLFLLLITRASMHASHRKLNSVDPTSVFERLCADVLVEYWGRRSTNTDAYILGTARNAAGKRHFPSDINRLCQRLGEGLGWKSSARSPGAGDGGMDIAVWTRFLDGRAGGLVGFAQCKTGDHWRDHLSKHQTRSYHRRYFRDPLIIDPTKIYMVPCRISEGRWKDDTEEGGLLFDRCRITQYASTFETQVLTDCRSWFDEAMSQQVTRFGNTQTMTRKAKK